MTVSEVVKARRDEILRIAERHGARNIRVFGSVARGDAGLGSDLDLLVDVAPVHSSWFPAGLIVDLEDLLGCEVDIVTEAALHEYVRDEVLGEAKPL